MPLQATSGAASYDAFGGGAAAVPAYIEEVFSTYLYTGTGGAQTITTGIDVSGKGGLVWTKARNTGAGLTREQHWLFDSARITAGGEPYYLNSNNTDAQGDLSGSGISFTSTGFSILDNYLSSPVLNYVSWTFREQPKFFDVVTYTGTGSNTTIAHALGSVPGSIIVKRTDTTAAWAVYHRSLANTEYLVLNTTAAKATGATWWNSTTPTSTVFSVGTDASVNASGGTYVAYLFAHDAGGFGLTGTDNVISCGSFTTDGSGDATVTLGYEPQWLLYKKSSGEGNWAIVDNMRGWNNTSISRLFPDSSSAETSYTASTPNAPTATGFTSTGLLSASSTYIYIAIRRGPMKVPTLGTSVFAPVTQAGGGFDTAGFPVDLLVLQGRSAATGATWTDRLRGSSKYLNSSSTAAESSTGGIFAFDNQTGVQDNFFGSGTSVAYWNFRRAPGFFDVVCGTSNASGNTFTSSHNLTVAPELLIIKSRGVIDNWWTIQVPAAKFGTLNGTGMGNTLTSGDYTGSASTFSFIGYVGNSTTHVAYLFATCAGVSKVGGYTGTGTTLQIDCGFTAGARFVLIKRTDASSDWYVWDTARGIVSGNDPYLLLNSTAAEVTSTDYIDTYSAGFEISSTAPAAINASGGTFIFLAIA